MSEIIHDILIDDIDVNEIINPIDEPKKNKIN